ncbi:AraC family transcriptional regulator [Agarilytica rhodophyticola]|uniref:AraC family transcriptional regulator n=1 Tax=Agarilytica rhodophyticola TaxID=1737490 RepID=UPI000B346003|nr:AraC family transcriptional regulator [Agarilytica rhodophyticola]
MNRYQDRFIQVVQYIEANLDEPINTNTLCDLVGLSKYHFHRQCSIFFGMSVMAFVKLLKLKRASYQLTYRSDMKVIDIALASGYDSHEAFSRAFKKYFSQSPSEFRGAPNWGPWRSKYEPIIKLRTQIMDKKVFFDVEITDFPKTLVAVMEHRGSPILLNKVLSSFIQWRRENSLPPHKSKTFNLIYDDPALTDAENYRFDVCCAIENPVEENNYGVINKTIPAGLCAKIRHVGSDDAIGAAVRYLYSTWIRQSNYELRDFPIFFERVSFFPDVLESDMITDVYLPIESPC